MVIRVGWGGGGGIGLRRESLEPEEAMNISTEQLYSRYSGLFSR